MNAEQKKGSNGRRRSRKRTNQPSPHSPKIAGARKRARAVLYPTKKGKKGKGKNSVNEVTTPTESKTTPPVGTSTRKISRITQDTDAWDRPVHMDEDEDEGCETVYILAPIRHREIFHQSKDWYVVHDTKRTIYCKSSTLFTPQRSCSFVTFATVETMSVTRKPSNRYQSRGSPPKAAGKGRNKRTDTEAKESGHGLNLCPYLHVHTAS